MTSKVIRSIYVKYVFIFGLLFLLVPGMLISLSQKYQEELTWGIGYIPVYISFYGVSLLLAVFYSFVLHYVSEQKVLRYAASVFFSILFCSAITINYINNQIVVNNLNYTFLYPRGIIEEAAKNGLFGHVEEDALLYIDGDHNWDGFLMQTQRQFYGILAPRKFLDIVRNKDIESFVPTKIYKSFYYLPYSSLSQDSGYAVLGRMETPAKSTDMLSKEVVVYVRVPFYKPIIWDWNVFSPKVSFLGKWANLNPGSSDFLFYDYHPSIQTIATGIHWRMYKISTGKAIDLNSLLVSVERNYVALSNYAELDKDIDFRDSQFFSKGWSFPESTLRWSEGKEAIVTFRLKTRPLPRKTCSLTISAGSNGNQRVTVLINNKEIGTLNYRGPFETKKIHFHSRILYEKGTNTITLKIPQAHTAGEEDPRVLGIYLGTLIISDQN